MFANRRALQMDLPTHPANLMRRASCKYVSLWSATKLEITITKALDWVLKLDSYGNTYDMLFQRHPLSRRLHGLMQRFCSPRAVQSPQSIDQAVVKSRNDMRHNVVVDRPYGTYHIAKSRQLYCRSEMDSLIGARCPQNTLRSVRLHHWVFSR
jgi:hypothetical protein